MAALPSDELSTLIGVLLGRGIDRRHVRRIVAETWRRGGSVSDAEARLTADFGLELPPRSEISANLRAVDRLMLRVVRLSDAEYPPCLQAVPDPPVALFVRGFVAALSGAMSVAVVGSRRATVAGRLLARALAADLGRAGVTVVSGLAVGIDGSAHRGALDVKARTVAVMGGGHNRIYPTSHRGPAEEVINGTGAILAEYPPTAARCAATSPSGIGSSAALWLASLSLKQPSGAAP